MVSPRRLETTVVTTEPTVVTTERTAAVVRHRRSEPTAVVHLNVERHRATGWVMGAATAVVTLHHRRNVLLDR
jgi:hypothetical protein